jgi:hypothetical protein
MTPEQRTEDAPGRLGIFTREVWFRACSSTIFRGSGESGPGHVSALTGRGDRMYGFTRAPTTVFAAAAAGFLLWIATQFSNDHVGDYWLAWWPVRAS